MGLIKWAAAEVNKDWACSTSRRRAAPAGGAGGDRRQARRPVRRRHLPDRQRHLDEHERQRGDRQPRERDRDRQARRQGAGPSQRPRQHGAVSNDVIPTAIHVAAAVAIKESLDPGAGAPAEALEQKAEAVRRRREDRPDAPAGRDADPAGAGVLAATPRRRSSASTRAQKAIRALRELPLGGTAVGTGINSHPEFADAGDRRRSRRRPGIDFVEAKNHFEAQAAKDARRRSVGAAQDDRDQSLTKIANDIRWLASGPRCGIGEISHPRDAAGQLDHAGQGQPGDERDGADGRGAGRSATTRRSPSPARGLGSTFELNVMMPVMAYNLLQSIELLAQRRARLRRPVRRGHRSQPRALRGAGRAEPGDVHEPRADHRLRQGGRRSRRKASRPGKTVRQVALEKKLLPRGGAGQGARRRSG